MGGRGSGGHNKKPSAIKKAQGNPGHRKINEQEPPTVPPASNDPPADMSGQERTFWNQIFPLVSEMRVMTSADVLALTQLCRFLAEEKACSEQIAKVGRLIPKKNEAGKVIGVFLNPLCRLRSDAARHVRSYLAVFGLGPSFRSAIQVDPSKNDQPQDPLDALFSGEDSGEIVQ